MLNVKIDIQPHVINIQKGYYENKEIVDFVQEPLIILGEQMYLKYLVQDKYIEDDGVNVEIGNVMDLHKKTTLLACKEHIYVVNRVKKSNEGWKRLEVVKALRYRLEGLIETVELTNIVIDRDLFIALDNFYNKNKK